MTNGGGRCLAGAHPVVPSGMLGGAAFVGFVPVRDTVVAREFYEGILELRVLADTPFALVVETGGATLRVTPVGEFSPQPFTVAGWEVADIGATVTALAERGVEFARYKGLDQDDLGIWTAPGGDRVAWFRDPDGNTLSLTAPAST